MKNDGEEMVRSRCLEGAMVSLTTRQTKSRIGLALLVLSLKSLMAQTSGSDAEVWPKVSVTYDLGTRSRIQGYFEKHDGEDISLEQLARMVYLSPFHLSRLFREQVGLPPHSYLNHIRVNRAKTLLNNGLAPAEVASAVGFGDQSHLNKIFKRIVGVPPGKYSKIRQDNLLATDVY